MGKDHFQWVSSKRVIDRFQGKVNSPQQEYESYIFRGVGVDLEHDFKQGNQKGLDVLGSDAFTERLIFENIDSGSMVIGTEDLVEAVADYFDLSKKSLSSTKRNRKHVEARSVLSFLARESMGASLTELATLLGRKVNTLSEFTKKLEISLMSNPGTQFVVGKLQDIIGGDEEMIV
jgi:hypothetical protein